MPKAYRGPDVSDEANQAEQDTSYPRATEKILTQNPRPSHTQYPSSPQSYPDSMGTGVKLPRWVSWLILFTRITQSNIFKVVGKSRTEHSLYIFFMNIHELDTILSCSTIDDRDQWDQHGL